jgi:hypothetical protein
MTLRLKSVKANAHAAETDLTLDQLVIVFSTR